MRIGIIGAGSMGAILGRHLARLGHRVSIANSRGPESLAALAGEIGARPVSVADAAGAGEIVIVAIPTKAVPDLPPALFANLPDSVVVIDIGNYHPELRDGRIDAIDRGMPDSEWVAQRIGRPVIKAFNNIFAKSLLEKGVARGAAGRIALSVAGDSADAKAAVLRLVDDLGFDPVDGGDLADSWRQQPGTPAYCRDLNAAALQKALAGAVPGRTAEYRAEQEARIRKAIAPARNRAYTGGCACGAIRYATKHAPVFQNHCQCRDCQRRSGTGHGSYLTFPARAEMAITGEATHWEVAGDSGNVKVHAFCPVCGTPVFLRFAAMPELIAVHAGSLDEPGRFAPQVLTYSVRGPAWDAIDPSLQAFERMPPA